MTSGTRRGVRVKGIGVVSGGGGGRPSGKRVFRVAAFFFVSRVFVQRFFFVCLSPPPPVLPGGRRRGHKGHGICNQIHDICVRTCIIDGRCGFSSIDIGYYAHTAESCTRVHTPVCVHTYARLYTPRPP